MSHVNIRAFRKLGGVWEARRNGMGRFYYTGNVKGHHYEVLVYDTEDDRFPKVWYIKRDGKPLGYVTQSPVEQIKLALMTPEYKGRFPNCRSCEGRGAYPCTVCVGGKIDCGRCNGTGMEDCSECEALDVLQRQWRERKTPKVIQGGKREPRP